MPDAEVVAKELLQAWFNGDRENRALDDKGHDLLLNKIADALTAFADQQVKPLKIQLQQLGVCENCWTTSWMPVPEAECTADHPHHPKLGETHVRCELCHLQTQTAQQVAQALRSETPTHEGDQVDAITRRLNQARRETWEAAAKVCDQEESEFDVALAVTKRKGDACRKLAAEFRRCAHQEE